MKTLVKSGTRKEEIKIIERNGSILTVAIGEKQYQLDVKKVKQGVYSVLHNGASHNMEIIRNENGNTYTVNSRFQSMDVEILEGGAALNGTKKRINKTEIITAPIPGTIIFVKTALGDEVKKDQTLVILSAMKMENELKSPIDGIVTAIKTNKGDIVQDGKVLVEVKAEKNKQIQN